MIRLQLKCVQGDYFDAWFSDHAGFDAQVAKAQVGCPHCGETNVAEAPVLKPGVYNELTEDQAKQMACDTRRMLEGFIGGGPEKLANAVVAATPKQEIQSGDATPKKRRPAEATRRPLPRGMAYDC